MTNSSTFRLATFNVENLYSRPTFWDPRHNDDQRIGNVFFERRDEAVVAKRIVEAAWSDEKCQLAALALLAANADVIALQEVDNRNALKGFRDNYLAKLSGNRLASAMKAFVFRKPPPTVDEVKNYRESVLDDIAYRQLDVIEANDGRGIDVGYLARRPVLAVKSHAEASFASLGVWPDGMQTYNDGSQEEPRYLTKADRLFKRDCLEVDFDINGAPLTLFICHWKSMGGGRSATHLMRVCEAMAVRALVERRFGKHVGAANWVICGDLNDYYEIDGSRDLRDLRTGEPAPSALPVLLDDGFAIDIMQRRAATDRWTTYHPADDAYTQLDYLLLSPALAAANPAAVPEIIRIGQPLRANRYAGPRLPRVGFDRPKASDHCPIWVDLRVTRP